MDWLEEELKKALAREERPVRTPARKWLAVAAAVIVTASGAAAWRQHQGMVAKEQLKLAIGMAAVRVHHIQAEVRQVTQ